MPSIISFASFCYSKHSDLFFNSSSQTGVQQGDPLGQLLFSLAIWPLIDDIESKLPNLLKHCWYLDGGVIAGTETELCTALEILSELEEKISLELRKDKCELWSIESITKIDNLIKRNCVDGTEILGAAIGSDAFVASSLLKGVKKLEELLENLAYVDDLNVLLVFCVFALVLPKWSTICNAILLRTNQIKSFENLLWFSVQPLKVFLGFCCQTPLGLPINKTGLGLRRSADQVQAAYVESVFQSYVLVEKLSGHNPTEDI